MRILKTACLTALVLFATSTVNMTALAASGHSDHKGSHGGMQHGKRSHGGSWMASLDEAQRDQIRRLHLSHKQQMALIKAKLKQARIELALLISNDEPKQAAIDKKIDALADLSRDKFSQKAKHHTQIRSLLNEKQRLKFDMHLLMVANKGKHGHHAKGKHGRHGK